MFCILLSLPSEIINIIDSFLGYKDFIAFHSTCHYLQQCVNYIPYDQDAFNKAIRRNQPSHLQIMISYYIEEIDVTQKFFLSEAEFPEQKAVYNELCIEGDYNCIHFCILKGFFECASILLDLPKAYIPCFNEDLLGEITALKSAFGMGNYAVCKKMLQIDVSTLQFFRIQLDEEISELGYVIAMFGDMDLFYLWYNDERCDPSGFDDCNLESACSNGRVEMVKVLLADARVCEREDDTSHQKGLQFACLEGHTEVVRLLLNDRRFFDPTQDDNAAWMNAINNHQYDIVQLLLDYSRLMTV